MPLLEVRGLRRDIADRSILTNISFSLEDGEILFVRGPSGVGKSLLLRAITCLDHLEGGSLLLHGRSPAQLGAPAWRTAVSYLPQCRASSLRGTPAELYFQAQRFGAQRGRPRGDLPALVHSLGLEQAVLNQQWGELSGGQAQRVAVAISVALGPRVLLLDEPTSACDPAAVVRVERVLAGCGAALVWVTHDPGQPARVGGRVLELPLGNIAPLPSGPQQQHPQQPHTSSPHMMQQHPRMSGGGGADTAPLLPREFDGAPGSGTLAAPVGFAEAGGGKAGPEAARAAELPYGEEDGGGGDGESDAASGYGCSYGDSLVAAALAAQQTRPLLVPGARQPGGGARGVQ